MDAVKSYTLLTKPGIIMGNVITIAGGFALATTDSLAWGLLFATLLGLSLMIASSCILNNYIDKEIDAKMKRTQHRPFVTKIVSEKKALLLSTILGLIGLSFLITYTNRLTVGAALFGFLVYVLFYGFWKRWTHYGTLIGSLAGAIPPVVGYLAINNRLDRNALLLFILLIVWQMPHFFAIALYRIEDYRNASLPVFPLKKGILATKVRMLLYVLLFLFLAFFLTKGVGYRIAASFFSSIWLGIAISGFWQKSLFWARQMFFASLLTITALFITLILQKI